MLQGDDGRLSPTSCESSLAVSSDSVDTVATLPEWLGFRFLTASGIHYKQE